MNFRGAIKRALAAWCVVLSLGVMGCVDESDYDAPPGDNWGNPGDGLPIVGDPGQSNPVTETLLLTVDSDSESLAPVGTFARAKVAFDGPHPSASAYEFYAVVDAQGALQGLAVKNAGLRKFYSLSQFEEGVALLTKHRGPISKDVIRMSVSGFSPDRGGRASVTLLRQYGLFSDDYRSYDIQVIKNTEGAWAVSRKAGSRPRAINALFFETRVVDSSQVGIESVDAKWQGQGVEHVNTESLPEAD